MGPFLNFFMSKIDTILINTLLHLNSIILNQNLISTSILISGQIYKIKKNVKSENCRFFDFICSLQNHQKFSQFCGSMIWVGIRQECCSF